MKHRRNFALMVMVLGLTSATFAESGIDTVVRLLETRYSVRHHRVHGLWIAKPFMIGSGVSGLRIAEFDNFRIPPGDSKIVQSELKRALGEEWTPFIESWSKKDREWSLIYARERSDQLQLLIVDSDNDDAVTVLQMAISGKARDRWITEPTESAKRQRFATQAKDDDGGGNVR